MVETFQVLRSGSTAISGDQTGTALLIEETGHPRCLQGCLHGPAAYRGKAAVMQGQGLSVQTVVQVPGPPSRVTGKADAEKGDTRDQGNEK